MKNLNLSLIALLFSSLLMGCGMSGPLYREAIPAPIKAQPKTDQNIEISTENEKTDTLITVEDRPSTTPEASAENEEITE